MNGDVLRHGSQRTTTLAFTSHTQSLSAISVGTTLGAHVYSDKWTLHSDGNEPKTHNHRNTDESHRNMWSERSQVERRLQHTLPSKSSYKFKTRQNYPVLFEVRMRVTSGDGVAAGVTGLLMESRSRSISLYGYMAAPCENS